jgi:hypothetical protein
MLPYGADVLPSAAVRLFETWVIALQLRVRLRCSTGRGILLQTSLRQA